jgi:hypothetical protein
MNMKNLLTLLLTVSVLVFLSGASATAAAQGKGPGASVSQGHGQGVSHDHDQVKAGSDAKGDHDSHTNWQTKFNERLQNHPALASRIDKLLPAGTSLEMAESGFKSPGQFIAALHVSKNLNIPFDQLKAKVTGVTMQANGQTTTTTPMSLGKAIHALRPNLTEDQANDAAKTAEKQASETEKADPKVSD